VLPTQGRPYTFTGSLQLQVNDWAGLNIRLKVKEDGRRQWAAGGLFLAGILVTLLILAGVARNPKTMHPARHP
jgi:hypothetical protein